MDKGLPFALNLARECKRHRANAVCVFGGVQASLVAEDLLARYPYVDLLVRAEAETTLPDLVRALLAHSVPTELPGLCFRERSTGEIRTNPPPALIEDLDRLPPADLSLHHACDIAIGGVQMPQLLRLAGFDYYRAWRPHGPMNVLGIPHQFIWKGIDGTGIIVTRGTYGAIPAPDSPVVRYRDDKGAA